jgi:hypothetical protein
MNEWLDRRDDSASAARKDRNAACLAIRAGRSSPIMMRRLAHPTVRHRRASAASAGSPAISWRQTAPERQTAVGERFP